MKQISKHLAATAFGMAALLSAGAFAQVSVREAGNGDLIVVDYKGKPPFKRQVISADERADFARFEAINDTVLVATSNSRRAGPPGKNLPLQQARFERVPQDQVVNIARVEETDGAGATRMWRGAPGKGRPRLGR